MFPELAALYREMKANPDDMVKRASYFEKLADARLDDYYALRDSDKQQAEILRLQHEVHLLTELILTSDARDDYLALRSDAAPPNQRRSE